MALVDGKGRFIWATCGQPGNCHDSTLLQSTDLWRRLHGICHLKTTAVGNDVIPALVLGDGAFPFRTFLMKRFSQANLTQEQKRYNKKHSHARAIVENAFGILKGRFRTLGKTCESSPENLRYKCLASVVLHNALVEREDYYVQINDEPVARLEMLQRQLPAADNAAAGRVRDLLVPLVQ